MLKDGAEKPGIDLNYFQNQQEKFQAYQRQRESEGHPQPLGIGVMMWDEVKVKDRLILRRTPYKYNDYKDIGFILTLSSSTLIC